MTASSEGRPLNWRWGNPEYRYPEEGRARLLTYLERRYGTPVPSPSPPDTEPLRLDPTRLSESDVRVLGLLVPQGRLWIDDRSRLAGSVGASYLDLVRIRQRKVPALADAVVEPASLEEAESVVHWADRERIALVPQSGGTSVVGGLDPLTNGHRAVVVVSDRKFSHPGEIRADRRLATLGAGMLGPEIEAELRRHGLTLGHFPQSFECSALGGWIAARSYGQASTRYQTPADRLQGFTLITPHSLIRWERSSGPPEVPDPGTIVPGSEGTLGLLVDATLRVDPLPERTRWLAALFPNWESGVEGARRLISGSPVPAVLRVSDGPETDLTLAESGWETGGQHERLRRLAAAVLRFRSAGLRQACLMIASYEGLAREVAEGNRTFRSLRKELRAAWLPARIGTAWEESRFRTPYLRDDFVERGWFVETFETFVPWAGLSKVKAAAEAAVLGWAQQRGVRASVGAHLSHPSVDGTALYFTVLAPQSPGDEERSWEAFKRATAEAVVNAGGPVSHHHGIGRYHRRWAARSLPPGWIEGLQTLKQRWDPNGIMNPGKTLPEG